jgi:L-rhamnose mutarotase
MPKPKIFTYTKKDAFRDAYLFIIICEGSKREPDYFRFFDGMSSRVKIVPLPNEAGKGSPIQLIENATKAQATYMDNENPEDQIWFVIDTDRWREQIRELRMACDQNARWNVVQSNPCFEVWMYYHIKNTLPELETIDKCKTWKTHLAEIIKGGFNSELHPIAIEVAAKNAKASYAAEGYTPLPGHTQVWMLAEALIDSIRKDLVGLKQKFPAPVWQ